MAVMILLLLVLCFVSSIASEEEGCGCGSDKLSRGSDGMKDFMVNDLTDGCVANEASNIEDSVGKMSISQIRKELNRREISTVVNPLKHDITDRERLVDILVSARIQSNQRENTFTEDMLFVPGGAFILGTNKPAPYPADGEGPPRITALSDFLLDRDEVTNSQFREFVLATGYETESEKFGWSFVFNLSLSEATLKTVTQVVQDVPWWLPVDGATWRRPEGHRGEDVFVDTMNPDFLGGRSNHAVTQVSWNDADAYCKWRNGSRLPTEAEWEYALKYVENGVSFRTLYPWGDEAEPIVARMNIWQGKFPLSNDAVDGWRFTCPGDAYEPQTILGFRNMLGNVWEWVEDWWTVDHNKQLIEDLNQGKSTEIGVVSDTTTMRSINKTVPFNPTGPAHGTEKVKKGGSFLCHADFCYRYRPHARHKNTPDSATSNNGFRCAKTIVPIQS